MKFTAERGLLLEAVTHLQKVVGSKTSMPVLEGILISAENGKLTLAAYNLEMGIKKEIYAKCDEQGDIVINARLLGDILRKLSGMQVEISANEKLSCTISCGEAEFNIMGMAAVDYPEMPSVAEGKKISIDSDIFADMVKGTIFSVAPEGGIRPILTGIQIKIENGILQFVAIDGHRLARRRAKVNIEENIEFIVQGKAVNELIKIADENTEKIDILVGKRLVSFNINGYLFITRLLEGEYVNSDKLIPEEYIQRVFLKRNEIIESVERISLLINDSLSTPLRFAFSEDNAIISSATSHGRAKENFTLRLEGEDFEIGLNSRYLLDALKSSDAERLIIRFNGLNSGVVIIDENEKNDDFLYLIMPMRMSSNVVSKD